MRRKRRGRQKKEEEEEGRGQKKIGFRRHRQVSEGAGSLTGDLPDFSV